MNRKYSLFVFILLGTSIAACSQPATEVADADAPATIADAEEFVQRVNDETRALVQDFSKAQWLQATYIVPDSQYVGSKAYEDYLVWVKGVLQESKRFEGLPLEGVTKRHIDIIKLGSTMPAPSDPAKIEEIAELSTELEGMYGAGKFCPNGEDDECFNLGQLSNTIHSTETTYEEKLAAWKGWRTISPEMRPKYQRFIELMNEGAGELGYDNVGVLWRSGYDMDADAFAAELEHLWGQVEPLYEGLHCYVRERLADYYGDDVVDRTGPIPAHLLGNMWAQEWGNIYPLVEPYQGVSDLNVTGALEAMRAEKLDQYLDEVKGEPSAFDIVDAHRQADDWVSKEMVRSAEAFYKSMGLRALPASFWEKSLFLKPRDRDVVCHASAWDLDMAGDVRIKMCIETTYEELSTIYHELGHLYYDLAYNAQDPNFQNGAHDGFHEAIGDTIVLAMTPTYLHGQGLIDSVAKNEQATINTQMKQALDKIAFLPFGLLIDQWRWRVMSGEIAPENYNATWWELRTKYQGIQPPVVRSEMDFDPGAKYHIPGNTPYTRYFLARVLQFQFYKALCDASGHDGPLNECSFYGSKEAGERFWAMMEKGQSQVWQETLFELTGTREMDASAIIEYFAPLMGWLEEQNAGNQCGW